MNNRKSNNILFIGVGVFAVGALLAFVGLRSSDKAVATPQSQTPAAANVDPNARTIAAGTTGAAAAPITFTVPKGKQAVAVELPSVAGLAGYAQPGDLINVYATIKTEDVNAKFKSPLVKLVLQGVKVLDVRAPAPGTAGVATYLLALNVDEAEQVIFYAKYQSMWMALASADQKPVTSHGRNYLNLL
jgi:hypothetical protein